MGTNVTTMDELRHAFPALDAVDHKRRRAAPCAFNKYFPRIEAVIMFGEPVRWETSLQLLLDVLMTDGHPSVAPSTIPQPHLPILACNMDLQWMAEAPMPRFGHGAFLLCVENLYKKLTGCDLVYTALIGKPSEITYRHGEHVLQKEAENMGLLSQEHLLHRGQHLHGHLRSELVQQLLAEETTGHTGQGGDPWFSQHRQPGLLLWQSAPLRGRALLLSSC